MASPMRAICLAVDPAPKGARRLHPRTSSPTAHTICGNGTPPILSSGRKTWSRLTFMIECLVQPIDNAGKGGNMKCISVHCLALDKAKR